MGATIVDITGETFGRVQVIGCIGVNPIKRDRKLHWICVCSCGTTFRAVGTELKSGNIKSCGCLKSEVSRGLLLKHGGYQSPSHWSWTAMKSRCYKKSDVGYHNYGGRGITVCPEWLNDFGRFLEDMGERPDGTSLDRIDSNGDYCKDNCRWASREIQSFNRRKSTNNTSGRTGVCHNKQGKWKARIHIEGKPTHLGSYETFEEACAAREEAELKYYGFTKE